MSPVETIKYKGYNIEVFNDECTEDPRGEDNLGTMACFHGRYRLGDDHDMSIKEAKKLQGSKKFIVLPLYLYEHSGITMSTGSFSCSWDSGIVGFIYVSKEKVRKEFSWKHITMKREDQIKTYLQEEVEQYDCYLKGDVYGYEVKDPAGEDIEDGQCGGFYGWDHKESGLLENAQRSIECELYADEEEAREFHQVFLASMEELPLIAGQLETEFAKKFLKERYKKGV